MHVLPLQQPVGHDTASQRHAPETQRWPLAHIAAPPHVQAPLALHPSARMPHDVHEAPAGPHAAAVRGDWQVEPEQHPSGHVLAL